MSSNIKYKTFKLIEKKNLYFLSLKYLSEKREINSRYIVFYIYKNKKLLLIKIKR